MTIGAGIREPGRLDDDAGERRHLPDGTAVDQVAQLVRQVAPQRAAEAAGGEEHRALVDAAQDRVVDADLAELVHDHGGLAERGVLEEPADQRRLPAAEVAGHEHDGSAHRHSASSSRGSSGSSGLPVSRSAATQRPVRSSTTSVRPL